MNFSKQKLAQGFGLVELIVVMFIVSILVGLAAPGFGNLVQTNTITEVANRFVSGAALARNEAATRNAPVAMCASNNAGNTCNNNGQWENGWIIWADLNRDNALTAADEIIAREDPLPAGFTLRAGNNQFVNVITYDPFGNATGDGGNGAEVFSLCEPTGDITLSRAINLNGIGRAWVNQTPGTDECP